MCDSHAGAVGSVLDREVLPQNVKPFHYALTLEPDFEKFTFEGSVVIDLDVREDSNSIALNAVDLDIHSTEIISGGQAVSSSPRLETNEKAQNVTVSFDQVLPAGSKAQLKQTFTGDLNENMVGFYRCKFKGADGSTKYMASSQMEPTDARRAFPCFDEPLLKAEFTVTLIADRDKTCLSNMDVASETEVISSITNGPRKAVTFNRSPLMSTYLVGLVVGDLDYLETNDFRVPIRAYVTPDQDREHARFSLDVAAKSLSFYEKVFDNQFPLPKMDMIAVPDFSAGAMENWGLVTYRTVDLLYDPKTASIAVKKNIAITVTHELAHQWFGNLVTMDFWDGLWLKEGFATWMSWYCCNEQFPEWKVWETYVVEDLQLALDLDAFRTSHPVEVPVKRAVDVNQIFDDISYSKGSSVLGMICKYVGEEKFIEGLRAYIQKHAYGNTKTDDLWHSLTTASGKPVDQVMDFWTKKLGFPVVSVQENPEKGSITLTQNRFLSTGDVTPEEDKTIYPVILNIRSRDGSVDSDTILDKRQAEIPIGDLDFFKINADHFGVYHTRYSPERLVKLGLAAKQGLLTVEDRAGMIADCGALSRSGQQPTSASLSFFDTFRDESSYVPWSEIAARFASIRAAWKFENEDVTNALRAFLRDLFSPKAHEVGWTFQVEEDSHTQELKALMFSVGGNAGDEGIISAAKELFSRFAAGDTEAVHPNIRGHVFRLALQNGGEPVYNVILDRYRHAPTSSEKDTALDSLSTTADPALVQRTLALALSDEVRSQDVYYAIARFSLHASTITARWNWFKENYDAINKRLPSQLGVFGIIVKLVLNGMTTDEQYSDVREFFKQKDLTGFDQLLERALDGIRSRAEWVKRDRQDVQAWLKEKGYLQ